MKKAQIEILGLAVIVIILVIGGVFFIKYNIGKKDSNLGSYTDPEMAQSFLNALMKTDTDYSIVSNVISNCYSVKNHLCGGDCCDYAHYIMTSALEATLGEWGKSYRLTIRKGSDKKIKDIPANSDCTDLSEKEQPGFYSIPPPPEPIIVKLEICKS